MLHVALVAPSDRALRVPLGTTNTVSQGLVTLGLPMWPLMINVRRSKAMQRSIQRAMPLDFVKHLFIVKCRAFDFPEFVRRQLQIRPRTVPTKRCGMMKRTTTWETASVHHEIVHVCSVCTTLPRANEFEPLEGRGDVPRSRAPPCVPNDLQNIRATRHTDAGIKLSMAYPLWRANTCPLLMRSLPHFSRSFA